MHIGQDFNVNNMASAIAVQRGEDFHGVGELTGLVDTPHLIEVLAEKFPDHPITIYPDASGGSRKTVNASRSDITLLRDAGHTVRVKPTNPPVKDRILSVNTGYAKGRLYLNATLAPNLAEAQEQQAYDKNGEPDKSGGFDHVNDAWGYLVHYNMPVRRKLPRIVEQERKRRGFDYGGAEDEDEVNWKTA